jgi:uncharacterized protein DUF4386
MSINVQTTTAQQTTGPPKGFLRKTSLAAGGLYVLTFAASIPALFLIAPVLSNPDYVIGAGADTQVMLGCFLDLITALAGIGTAVALFPVVKRQSEALALGFVTSRMFEAAAIAIGIVSILSVVTLRQDFAAAGGTDPAQLVTIGHSLVAVRNWTFLLGPNYMAAVNALLLGTLMYRSRLVPRLIPVVGLIGAPLLFAASTALLFGVIERSSMVFNLAVAPIFAWELSLGLWMLVKGFRSSPITTGSSSDRAAPVIEHAVAA